LAHNLDALFDLFTHLFAEITEEQLIHGDKWWKTHPMTFDLALLHKNMVFEYQGEQHYYDLRQLAESAYYAANDETKAVFCAMNGVMLVAVPFWYDQADHSVRNTLQMLTQ